MKKLRIVCSFVLLILSGHVTGKPAEGIQASFPDRISYEGDVSPDQADPQWFFGNPTLGDVIADPDADGATAFEWRAVGGDVSGASWGLHESPALTNFDNARGWTIEIRHKAISNSGLSLDFVRANGDSDHFRINDGLLHLGVDFRPGEVRVGSFFGSGVPCSSRPNQCKFYRVPMNEYATVVITGQGSSFTAKVNDFEPFTGVNGNPGGAVKFLNFGNGSAGRMLSAVARWDYVRLDMRGPRIDPAIKLEQLIEQLVGIVVENAGSDLADKVQDVLSKAEETLAKLEDRQGAVGAIEGAVGDLDAAIDKGLDPTEATQLMDDFAACARQLAQDAIDEAIDRNGDSAKIAEAERAFSAGDVLRTGRAYKDAVAQYKDAISQAEGA